jgi:hypothetical protein
MVWWMQMATHHRSHEGHHHHRGRQNITPSELENDLKFSPYITDAVVIGGAYLTRDHHDRPGKWRSLRDQDGSCPAPPA